MSVCLVVSASEDVLFEASSGISGNLVKNDLGAPNNSCAGLFPVVD